MNLRTLNTFNTCIAYTLLFNMSPDQFEEKNTFLNTIFFVNLNLTLHDDIFLSHLL